MYKPLHCYILSRIPMSLEQGWCAFHVCSGYHIGQTYLYYLSNEEKIQKKFYNTKCLKKHFILTNLLFSMLLSAEFEEPHNYEAIIPYRRHSGNSINLRTAKEITGCKSAKPINIVTPCGMKMCQKWYFLPTDYEVKHPQPCCFTI